MGGYAGDTDPGRVIRRGLLVAAVLACVAPAVVPSAASAEVDCSFDSDMKKVEIGMSSFPAVENVVIMRTKPSGRIEVTNYGGDQLCTEEPRPTTTTVDTIEINQYSGASTGRVEIYDPVSFAPGAFDEGIDPSEIEFDIDLGNTDICCSGVVLTGTGAADDYRVGPTGIDVNAPLESITRDSDISLAGVTHVRGYMRGGADAFSGRGFALPPVATDIRLLGDGGKGGDLMLGGDADINDFDGREGNDVFEPGPGKSVVYGGEGGDTISYENAAAGVTVDLDNEGEQDTGAGMLVQTQFEHLRGSPLDDELRGNGKANKLLGLFGVDQLFAKDQREDLKIDCGEGDDVLEVAKFDKGLDPKPQNC